MHKDRSHHEIFTCRLMDSLFTSDSKEHSTVEIWQSSESRST